jgi:hypothetical protein
MQQYMLDVWKQSCSWAPCRPEKLFGELEIRNALLVQRQEKMVFLLHTTVFIFSDFNRLPDCLGFHWISLDFTQFGQFQILKSWKS